MQINSRRPWLNGPRVDFKGYSNMYTINGSPSAEVASSGKKRETWGWGSARSADAEKENTGCLTNNVR
jgi:hypothetical protein